VDASHISLPYIFFILITIKISAFPSAVPE
jgi:hypothetical protein